MSTKIYDGLRLTPAAQALHFTELPRVLNEIIDPIRKRLELELVLLHAVAACQKHLDDPFVADAPRLGNIIFEVADKIDAAKLASTRNPYYGLEFSLTFLRNHLAIPYAQRTDYVAALLASPYFEEYGYWDNADEPDGMDPAQWKQRAEDWEEAMAPSWVAAKNGLTYENEALGSLILAAWEWSPDLVNAAADRLGLTKDDISPAVSSAIALLTAAHKPEMEPLR